MNNFLKGFQNTPVSPLSKLQKSKQSQLVNYQGHYNFYVEGIINNEQNLNEDSVLQINCYQRSDCLKEIKFKTNWFKIDNELSTQIMLTESNKLILSADNIGFSIKAEITSLDPNHKGVALVIFQKVQVSLNSKDKLETIMSSGLYRSKVLLVNEAKDMVAKEKSILNIGQQSIRIQIGENSSKGIELRYGLNLPKLECDLQDSTKLSLVYKGDEEDYEKVKTFLGVKNFSGELKLGIKSDTKSSRDFIIMSIRCFGVKKLYEQQDSIKQGLNIKTNEDLLEIFALKNQIHQLVITNKSYQMECSNLKQSIKDMEKELESTILTYQQINKNNSNESPYSPDMKLKRKLQDYEKENQRLQEKILILQVNQQSPTSHEDFLQQLSKIKQENEFLQNKLKENKQMDQDESFISDLNLSLIEGYATKKDKNNDVQQLRYLNEMLTKENEKLKELVDTSDQFLDRNLEEELIRTKLDCENLKQELQAVNKLLYENKNMKDQFLQFEKKFSQEREQLIQQNQQKQKELINLRQLQHY